MEDDVTGDPPPAPPLTQCRSKDVEPRDIFEYDADTDTYRASFDKNSRSIGTAVVSMVATISDTDPEDLGPLQSMVNPDALDRLLNPDIVSPSRGDTHVTFTLDGYDVTVHSYGFIDVRPPENKRKI